MHRSSEVRRDDNVVVDGKDVVEVENCSCFCTDELGDVFVADGKPDVVDTGEHGLGSDRGFHVCGWERRVAVIDDEDLPGFEMDESCEEDCFEDFDVGVVTGDDEGGAAGEGGVGEGVHVDADVGGVWVDSRGAADWIAFFSSSISLLEVLLVGRRSLRSFSSMIASVVWAVVVAPSRAPAEAATIPKYDPLLESLLAVLANII